MSHHAVIVACWLLALGMTSKQEHPFPQALSGQGGSGVITFSPSLLSSPRESRSPPDEGQVSRGSSAATQQAPTAAPQPRRPRIVAPPNSRMPSLPGSEATSPRIMAEPPPELRGGRCGAAPAAAAAPGGCGGVRLRA